MSRPAHRGPIEAESRFIAKSFAASFPAPCNCGPIEAEALMRLKVLFEPSDDGGYTAHVPSLPGCISEGDTLDDARRNIREAIELYLEPDEEPVVPQGGHVEEIAV